MPDAKAEAVQAAVPATLNGGLPARRDLRSLILMGGLVSLLGYAAHTAMEFRHGYIAALPFGRDFVNFWVGTRLALAGNAAALTDLALYNEMIARIFDRHPADLLVFSYPPHVFAPLVPFALLPYKLAVVLWTAMNLGALALSAKLVLGPASPERWRRLASIAALSPAAITMVTFGHFGGVLALTAVAALQESERRPWLAGICLSVISLKPQFALILGLVLLLAGRWPCLVVAALGTAVLVAVSLVAFGLDPWRGYLTWTLPFQSRLMTDFAPTMLHTVISVYFTCRVFIGAETAWLLQGLVSVAAILGSAYLLRSRVPAAVDLFLILLAAIVALPYANAYDLAIAVPALTVWLFDRTAAERTPRLLVAVWVLPPMVWMLAQITLPVSSIPIAAALLAGLAQRCLSGNRTAGPTASRAPEQALAA